MLSESRLSDVLSEFARTLGTDFPIQRILDHLVKRIVDVLPISAAGVTLISPTTEPRFVAASDESAMRFEQLQTDVGEGPCLLAYETGVAIAIPDLRNDGRFPRFADEAREQGLVAVFTFPLRDRDRRLGALDLYRTSAGPLDERAMAVAQTLADVATAYLLNAQARVDLQAASERAREASLHDSLTGLPNRTLLLQRLEHAVARSSRSGRHFAVLYVDLDRFKHVNDSLGHLAGDELLVAVADRIAPVLRAGDTLARMAGDEFVILCEELDSQEQGEHVAGRIQRAMERPFRVSGTAVPMTASIGIAFGGGDPPSGAGGRVPRQSVRERDDAHAHRAQRLLHEADTAMYTVKQHGGGGHGVVDATQLGAAEQRLSLSRELRRALDRRELFVVHQPITTTPGTRLIGAEALVRWTHPRLGAVPPTVFVPVAEDAGLIEDIGRFVLERACRDRHSWPPGERGAHEELLVAVNVSPLQLMTGDLVHTVADVLAATGTPPGLLTLEVTESALFQDRARALHVLEGLKGLGVMLALDDFGTGSSSLSHLRDFPVDIVKIDRTFVADLTTLSTSRHIVEAVVTLAHRLGMRVVAEGVETERQRDAVQDLDCDYVQGYLCSPPVPTDAFSELVAGHRRAAAPGPHGIRAPRGNAGTTKEA